MSITYNFILQKTQCLREISFGEVTYQTLDKKIQKYNEITMFDKVICGPHLFAQLEFDPSQLMRPSSDAVLHIS